jgi:DNA-binding transcriptional LysR family regulator
MNVQIEFRLLRYFRAVAETLHFGRAAAQLGISQPPLSQQIKMLEEIVGYRLFDRTTRGVKLTPVGRFFLERANKLLEGLERDIEMARRLGEGQEGVLSVGFSGSIMYTRLPFAIERYRKLFPKVELHLQELVTTDQMTSLKEGILDVGFLRDGESDPAILLETLQKERFVAILPKRHRLARKQSLRPGELRDEPFVFFARKMGARAYDRTIACCEEDGFRPRIVQDTPQWPTAVRLIAAGLGVSIAPACVASLAMPDVVYKPLRSSRRTSVDIGTRQDFNLPVVSMFLTIIRKEFV